MSGESNFKCTVCGYEWCTQDYAGCPQCREMRDELERVKKQAAAMYDWLKYAEETMVIPLMEQGDCYCDLPEGKSPCSHCAAEHFNEWYCTNFRGQVPTELPGTESDALRERAAWERDAKEAP